jgi:hypothetical protein
MVSTGVVKWSGRDVLKGFEDSRQAKAIKGIRKERFAQRTTALYIILENTLSYGSCARVHVRKTFARLLFLNGELSSLNIFA